MHCAGLGCADITRTRSRRTGSSQCMDESGRTGLTRRSRPFRPFPRMASSSWSRRDGRGEAAKSVQLRRLGGSRLRCRTRRLRWLGTSRAQFLPENPPIGTSSVHGTSSTWKRARVLSVLALASCSERIWVDAPAHRQRTMGRAERRSVSSCCLF